MTKSLKTWGFFGLLTLFTAWWAARQISFEEVWLTLSQISLGQIALLITLNIAIVLLFSSRWWLILKASGRQVPYLTLAGYRLAAFAVSYFTPGTQFGGEPLQVHLLSKKHQIPPSLALASVALDKLFELLANFTFLSLGIILIIANRISFAGSTSQGWLIGLNHLHAILWISFTIVVPVLYLFLLRQGRFPLARLSSRLPNFLLKRRHFQNLPAFMASTERQISTLFRHAPGAIWASSFLSGLIWLLLLAEFWLMIHLLGANLTITQLITAVTAARLAFLTPLPGGAGVLEASQILAMQALGYSPALGISISLLIRARDISLGLFGLWLGAVLTRKSPSAVHETEQVETIPGTPGSYPLQPIKEV